MEAALLVLKENFVHYFKSDTARKPDGVIPLEGSRVAPSPPGTKTEDDFVFELIACNRSYLLKTTSDEDVTAWVSELKRAAQLKITDFYDVKQTLGEGTFAKVKLGILKRTGVPYAIKIIDKATLAENREALLTEISILKQVKHPNVIGLIDIFETRKKLYLIMKVLSGGELFDRIVEKGTFSEADAAALSRKILGATEYLHGLGIVHRDLKPENLLYENESEHSEVQIADFGLSKFASHDELLKTACGTPGYVAPEVLHMNGYGKEVDLWSIGVIIYILLCGFPPFYAEDDNEMFEMIKEADYDFPSPYWDEVGDSAKDLVRKLLEKDPELRLTATQALEHEWVKGDTANTEANESVIETLKVFNARRKFQMAAGKVMMVNRFKS